jgi:hypothetical protein
MTLDAKSSGSAKSRLVCPECGQASVETMPTDACLCLFLRVRRLRSDAPAEAGRLLRVLFLR